MEESSQKKSEIIKINNKSEISNELNANKNPDFEEHIIETYKILSGYYTKTNQEKNKNIKLCEIEMNKALDICEKNEKINLNKNILDKISRIMHYNKISILFILSKIFISLMQKNNLFEKKSDLNNIIYFMNEILNLNKILKETYIGYKLNLISQKFFEKISKEFSFEFEQSSNIKNFLKINAQKMKPYKLKLNSFEEMLFSLNDSLQIQENHIIQYKIIIDNFNYILAMINEVDLDERNNLENYIELGKIFVYLLYNNKYVIFLKKQSSEGEGSIKIFYDCNEDNYLFNIIEGEKFFIEYDNDIHDMQEKICELVLIYVEKYKGVNNIFDFQYVLYILAKRIFFLFDGKFREKIEPIIAEIMVNLCFYKINSIEEIKIFIKEILNSTDEKNKNFKNLLKRKIDFISMNPNFQLKLTNDKKDKNKEKENRYNTNIENISNEALFLLEGDLKLGYFLSKNIKNGEYFNFYVEITKPYSIIDFCINIDEYNIKLSIKDLNEEKYIIKNNEINSYSCPYKICLFFTKPVIFEFIFDNSYSWIRDKNIKYKVNIFYPQKSFYIKRKILLFKYQEKLFKYKNLEEEQKNSGKNLFLIKFNGQNKAFNSLDVLRNIKSFDTMLEDKFISINSIYISISIDENDISYFYYKKKDRFEKLELNKNNFENYIKENILKEINSNETIRILNLFLIKGINTENKNSENAHYNTQIIDLEDILGFIPEISSENNEIKILFFYQYLLQAQLIYFLFKSFNKKENKDIVYLIHYIKNIGLQICQYKNGEIKLNPENFSGINLNQNFEKNMEIICDEIKKYENKRKVEILIPESIHDEENIFDFDKINKYINNKLNIKGDDDDFCSIQKLDNGLNEEIKKYSHIFYLD